MLSGSERPDQKIFSTTAGKYLRPLILGKPLCDPHPLPSDTGHGPGVAKLLVARAVRSWRLLVSGWNIGPTVRKSLKPFTLDRQQPSDGHLVVHDVLLP